jgi:hypothetical protein
MYPSRYRTRPTPGAAPLPAPTPPAVPCSPRVRPTPAAPPVLDPRRTLHDYRSAGTTSRPNDARVFWAKEVYAAGTGIAYELLDGRRRLAAWRAPSRFQRAMCGAGRVSAGGMPPPAFHRLGQWRGRLMRSGAPAQLGAVPNLGAVPRSRLRPRPTRRAPNRSADCCRRSRPRRPTRSSRSRCLPGRSCHGAAPRSAPPSSHSRRRRPTPKAWSR